MKTDKNYRMTKLAKILASSARVIRMNHERHNTKTSATSWKSELWRNMLGSTEASYAVARENMRRGKVQAADEA